MRTRLHFSKRPIKDRHPLRDVRQRAKRNHHDVPIVSVIVPVMNERKTIGAIVREARQVHRSVEVLVVANGCTDGTSSIARRYGATVLEYENPLGHDVGRTVGAQAARGKVLLFIDGDMIISAKELRPFVDAVLSGTDVALNQYSGPVNHKQAHPVVLAKHVLNGMLSRSDLKGASMTAVPHALSRKALNILGSECLSVPPLALTIAVHSGLKVAAVRVLQVGRMNRKRTKRGSVDPLLNIIVSDHMQAIRWLMEQTNERNGCGDLYRERNRVR
ncbi:glycosyltransferase involved in cell wall biosynthesis [Paenibacillus sp. DS2015]|uniref:glycosyltransferase family 2 protein n=1 Tax=Paenibacillus sp. DS2015 TaxID=3373917 RepID=UPI003D1A2B87